MASDNGGQLLAGPSAQGGSGFAQAVSAAPPLEAAVASRLARTSLD